MRSLMNKMLFMALFLAVFTAGCGGGGGAVNTTGPTVSLTIPLDGDTGVFLNQKITAIFSEAMDPATITTTTFTLKQGLTVVSGTVGYTGVTAVFTPASNLLPNTSYTATITTGAKNPAGDALVANKVWSFTTGTEIDTTAPTVTLVSPADGATGECVHQPIVATFSKELDPLTITTANFMVAGVTGTIVYDPISSIAVFTPDAPLAISTPYTATITTGVTDLAGNPLAADKVWTFTTGASTTCQASVFLGAASPFAILASAAITNIPTSAITGDVGLSPAAGSNISGFSVPATCPEVTGVMYTVDATGPACATIDPVLLLAAKGAAEIAFINARAAVRGTPTAISGNLNGLTFAPGLYESGTSIEISPAGILTLDAGGDANAVFIIRSATSITTEAGSQVVLAGSAKAANVYWTAGSAVTLGTNSIMKGTMIAGSALSLLNGASLEGRLLTQGAAATAITLDANIITVPTP